jgi:hypothetical protein
MNSVVYMAIVRIRQGRRAGSDEFGIAVARPGYVYVN